MANTKTTKTASNINVSNTNTSTTNTATTSTEPKIQTSTPTLDATAQLLAMMEQMQSQLASLSTELTNTKAELASTKEELNNAKDNNNVKVDESNFATLKAEPVTVLPPVYEQTSTQSNADKFLEILATRKSDKEVTIVHNREIVGGGTTHLALSNMTIDFTHFGETRTISMLQFEELTSKYRGFFNREIILVADKDRAVAEEYGVPCVKRKDGAVLGRADFERLGTMSIDALTNLYNSLTPNDRKFMLNYWLGQCYNRTPGFYDRYKIESLNALSKSGVFDTLIAFMNGETLNAGRVQSQNTGNQQTNNIVGKA